MSTFFVMYGAVRLAPEDLRVSVLPPNARVACASLGVVVGMFGALIAVWGVVCLGRSFGIFVAVRQVVLHGIYRYVRHPIYLGYLFIWAGLVLVHQSFIILPLVGLHAALMVFRARLEERRLCEASPAYREYVKHTGFLFPLAFRRAR